ncbi:MAG: phosphoglucomutase/phosphomannomutase family protein [Candidatus Omnitrophota bacterium]
MQEIKFGTDGFRGIIADNFTFNNVRRIGRAMAKYIKKLKLSPLRRKIIVGYDRRFLSDKFADAIAKEISSEGVSVLLSDTPVPTPAVSFYIRAQKLPGGIIITASHNPAHFNGVKIKNEFGASAENRVTTAIENWVNTEKTGRLNKVDAKKVKSVKIIAPYIKNLCNYLNFSLLKKCRFKILVDVMHGSGSGVIEQILKGTDCEVTTIHQENNPLFSGVNPEPIEINLQELSGQMKKNKYDLGIALDGDADRIGAMCPGGGFISSHYAICLLLLHFIENKRWTGRVLKSLNTTTMVEKITNHFGLPLEVVPVGFKYIAKEMLKGDVLLGGEESGGIGFKGYMPERDGILSGLLLLEMMAYRKQSILEIIKDMEKRFGCFFYLRKDLHLKRVISQNKIRHPKSILGQKVIDVKTYDGTKFIMEDESWLLIRASGTEPIVRIYAESKSPSRTKKLITFGCDQV